MAVGSREVVSARSEEGGLFGEEAEGEVGGEGEVVEKGEALADNNDNEEGDDGNEEDRMNGV